MRLLVIVNSSPSQPDNVAELSNVEHDCVSQDLQEVRQESKIRGWICLVREIRSKVHFGHNPAIGPDDIDHGEHVHGLLGQRG